jgi:hypothetical protein
LVDATLFFMAVPLPGIEALLQDLQWLPMLTALAVMILATGRATCAWPS